jgi:hypothetical protein
MHAKVFGLRLRFDPCGGQGARRQTRLANRRKDDRQRQGSQVGADD